VIALDPGLTFVGARRGDRRPPVMQSIL
jgi:hypothetical protein